MLVPDRHKSLSFETLDSPSFFEIGSRVQACQIKTFSRPYFFPATILKPILHVPDLYEGLCDGEKQVRRFFAHSIWQDAQSEAALLLHYRASLSPESFYTTTPLLFGSDGGLR